MKKTICILLVLAMMLALCSCRKETIQETAAPEPEAIPAAEPQEVFQLSTFDHSQYGYLRSDLPLPEEVGNANGFFIWGDTLSFRSVEYGNETQERTYTIYSSVSGGDFAPAVEFTAEPDGYYIDTVYDGTHLWSIYSQDSESENGEISSLESVRKLDAAGNVVAEFSLNDHFEGCDFFFTMSILPSADGGLWLTVSSALGDNFTGTILRFDSDLQPKWVLDDFTDPPSVGQTPDGDLMCVNKGQLCKVEESGLVPTGIELDNEDYWWTLISGSGGYDLFIYDSTTLYAADFAGGQLVALMDWGDWNISSPNLIGALSDSRLLTVNNGIFSEGSEILLLDRVNIADIPEKTTLTLAMQYEDGNITDAVAEFNNKSDRYHVELVLYDDLSQLDMEISSGNYPDILGLESDQSKYIRKGLLVDMLSLMEQYGGITRDDIVPSFLEASMNGDALYMIAPSFLIRTIYGLPEYVGTQQGWSLDQFITALENMPEDMYACDFGGQDFLEFLLGGLYREYVDVENGTCSFNSSDFITLLDALAKYLNFEDPVLADSDMDAIVNRSQMLDITNLFFGTYISGSDNFDQVTLVGYPGGEGNGADFNINARYGICSRSQNIEGAWEFMTFLLSDPYQSSFGGLIYPANQNALDAKIEKYAAGYEDIHPGTWERAQELEEYISNVKTIVYREYSVYDIIMEEVPSLLDGSKTARETAEIIQNRVSTYLAEQFS